MQPLKILFVCLGNICRSPIAHGIMEAKIKSRGLSHFFKIDSAGTTGFHINSAPDWRSITTLQKHGIILKHQARQFNQNDISSYDYILTMDHLNYDEVINLAQHKRDDIQRVFLLRSFDPLEKTEFDIPDPYYGLDSDFDEVYRICDRSINGFIKFLSAQNIIAPNHLNQF